MWVQATALLLACCLWSAETQSDGSRGQNIWQNPIKFANKAGDVCTMIITGQGDYTKLRVSCQGNRRSYWCDYLGKPYTCSAYNKNPRHYFVQIMWNLRKLQNACEGPRQILPHMCRKATDESMMIFSSKSFSEPETEPEPEPEPEPRPQPKTFQRMAPLPPRRRRPQNRPAPTRSYSARHAAVTSIRISERVRTTQRTTQKTTVQPTTPPVKSYAKRMAQRYCWRSLQGICSYFIGLVRN